MYLATYVCFDCTTSSVTIPFFVEPSMPSGLNGTVSIGFPNVHFNAIRSASEHPLCVAIIIEGIVLMTWRDRVQVVVQSKQT